MINRKGVDPDGRKWGTTGSRGKEAVFRLYCMRRETIFNKKKKRKNKFLKNVIGKIDEVVLHV